MGMIGRLSAVSFTSSPTFAGFFVSRHLGLAGCNIGYMKRFQLLFFNLISNRQPDKDGGRVIDIRWTHFWLTHPSSGFLFTGVVLDLGR
jgi:hypothetical protein